MSPGAPASRTTQHGPDRIHVVHKTHLDVGFTDTAANVLRRYREEYIPEAIRLASALRDEFGEPKFVWTTGAWLITHALECSAPADRERLHQAILDGLVVWHALPFTLETELLRRPILDASLQYSKDLDRAYGRETVAGKMTDVPGHTIGLVGPLAAAGVRYFHVGVNPATPVPETPQHFVWRDPEGREVVVSVDPDYGSDPDSLGVLQVPGSRDALFLAFTNDNLGPPTRAAVLDLTAALHDRYPAAEIIPSTLDAFGRAAWEARAHLPVVTQEIGDSWIYGVASDPILTSRLNRLQRARERWIADQRLQPGGAADRGLVEGLLLAAEHTWGYDRKTYLPDYGSYEKHELVRARAHDVVDADARVPSTLAYAKAFPPNALGPTGYEAALQSWDEKRARTTEAVAALPDALAEDVARLFDTSVPDLPPDATQHLVGNGVTVTLDGITIGVSPTGALTTLTVGGAELLDQGGALGELSYWVYGADDVQRWLRAYVRSMGTTGDWAVPDLGKAGLELSPRFQSTRTVRPAVTQAWSWQQGDAVGLRVALAFPHEASAVFGAPRSITIDYTVSDSESTPDSAAAELRVTVYLSDKDALLAPEATWLQLKAPVRSPHRWQLDKSGVWVDPHDVVRSGGRNWHAIQSARYEDAFQSIEIEPLDSPLCAIGRPRMFEWNHLVGSADAGFAFCLHNNCWGTNYRQWFDEPTRHDFRIRVSHGIPTGITDHAGGA